VDIAVYGINAFVITGFTRSMVVIHIRIHYIALIRAGGIAFDAELVIGNVTSEYVHTAAGVYFYRRSVNDPVGQIQ
jgi:hypothetical protein